MSMIKLSRITFDGSIQAGGLSFREYQLSGVHPARYDAYLHGGLQCIVMRDPTADSTLYIPLRLVRSMEVYDKDTLPDSSIAGGAFGCTAMTPAEVDKENRQVVVHTARGREEFPFSNLTPAQRHELDLIEPGWDKDSSVEKGIEPRRRGRPRTKHLGAPGDTI